MSGELRVAARTGLTVYGHIFNENSQRWNGSTFENFNAANYANYDIALTEQGSTGTYVGDMPSSMTAGSYDVVPISYKLAVLRPMAISLLGLKVFPGGEALRRLGPFPLEV